MTFLRPLSYFENRFHEKQVDAWLAYKAGLDLVLDWGRRSGKSEFVADVMIEDVETYGKDCMYLAVTQTQGREIMWPKFRKLIGDRTRDWKSNETRLEWRHKRSNALISLKGFDQGVDKLRGGGKRLIVPDEWAFLRQIKKGKKKRSQILAADQTLMKEVFAPQLADYGGQIMYLSTPKGRNHFWKLKQRALRDQSMTKKARLLSGKRRKFFTSSCTMFENSFISDEGRLRVIEEYSGPTDPLYRQEILAEYIVLEGLAFALPPDSYTVDRWDAADLDHSFHWRGVDHGYSPDPTACTWFAYNRKKGYTLLYSEYRMPKLLIKQHADAITAQEPYRIMSSLSDIDPQVLAEYAAIGLDLSEAGKHDKESRILRLVNALRTGKLKIARDCEMLLDEMSTYEWYQDGNDDLIDSMNYGYNNFEVPREVPAPTEEKSNRARANTPRGYGQSFGD